MLSRIPILDVAPEDYEPTPQLGWFIRPASSGRIISAEKVLYQLWQRTVISESPLPGQVWVKVEEYTQAEADGEV